jgi:hypothetical protein
VVVVGGVVEGVALVVVAGAVDLGVVAAAVVVLVGTRVVSSAVICVFTGESSGTTVAGCDCGRLSRV